MKKMGKISFISICLLVCTLPFAGMFVCPTTASTENRTLAAFPQIKENGRWNTEYMQELGNYFEDHFAFRKELVSADAEIQSRVFQVSNVDTVTVGKDGWLYYTASVDDYLGRNQMTKRARFNAAHNIFLMQQYVESQGARFLFTIAPNKNTLYGEHMPDYLQHKADDTDQMELFQKELQSQKVSYADLFSAFRNQKEILYLKRDSHWNQKGALLTYQTLMDSLNLKHDTYETVKAIRLKEEYGDLNKMLYPVTAEPEWNYYYQKEQEYFYQTQTDSVEDPWIVTQAVKETKAKKKAGTLLMFRDSFGNSLLPFLANAFSKACFSKAVPENITEYMKQEHPDVVILEKVERNVKNFATIAPLMEGPRCQKKGSIKTEQTTTSLQIEESENDVKFWSISGVLDQTIATTDARVYVRISNEKEKKMYEASLVSTKNSEYGYQLYLLKDSVKAGQNKVEVIMENKSGMQVVQSAQKTFENPKRTE